MEKEKTEPTITPEELMYFRVTGGEIKLHEYIQWMMTDKTWERVKEFYENRD